ncbi:UDP-2,4-diacetamido-2,4,6-trideoxy-beta-L-altropyranose hydrolase [Candidatus Gottesmanbacteria bacterium]|nr:UDP-2,4-diacetamido-2,4,6-trideoxy-beta-L-altropyranose hydrolase [Candidatus Gottesmanbacteria bacterium]
MKIAIFTEGNNRLGLGHIIRCIALYQAFEDKKADLAMYANCDHESAKIIKRYNHRIIDWVVRKEESRKIISKSDIVVIDSVKAPLQFYQYVSSLVKIPVYIDDTLRLPYPRSILINRTLYAQKFKINKRRDSFYLLGSQFLPLTKAFWYIPRKTIRKKIGHILITFGGSDLRNMTSKILKSLSVSYPDIRKTVVVGRAFNNIKQIEDVQDRYTSILYYPTGEILKNMFLDADIVISAGGQTLYELARIGAPTISITIVNNQENNISGWKQARFIEHAGSWNDKNILTRLNSLISKMDSYNLRLEKSRIGRKLVDGKGSKRIVEFVLKKYSILN